jgi:hypothetical protein
VLLLARGFCDQLPEWFDVLTACLVPTLHGVYDRVLTVHMAHAMCRAVTAVSTADVTQLGPSLPIVATADRATAATPAKMPCNASCKPA